MELDIHLKTGDCSVLFSIEKMEKLWSYSVQRTQEWNVEYMLVERIIRDFSFLFFNVTIVTSYITSKKWTDDYVSGLNKINNGLQKNEERVLNLIDKTESVINDPSKRLKFLTGGKVFADKTGEAVIEPVVLIKEHLAKDTGLEAACEQVATAPQAKTKKTPNKKSKKTSIKR